jgi:GNAT superfamily N-acetyltransferase
LKEGKNFILLYENSSLMIVRQFRENDAKEVSDLIIRNLREINSKFYPEGVIDELAKENTLEKIILAATQRLVLVAHEFDEIIGTATVNSNFFGSVFVKPEYHHKGVGTKLMDSLESLAKTNGLEEVALHSSVNAVKFYEKRGYSKGKFIDDPTKGKSYEMKKKL